MHIALFDYVPTLLHTELMAGTKGSQRTYGQNLLTKNQGKKYFGMTLEELEATL